MSLVYLKITDDGIIKKQLRLLIYSEQDTYENIAIILVCVSTPRPNSGGVCAGVVKQFSKGSLGRTTRSRACIPVRLFPVALAHRTD